MQLIASGKWSKEEKVWKLVLALRRPAAKATEMAPARLQRRPAKAKAAVVRLAERRDR